MAECLSTRTVDLPGGMIGYLVRRPRRDDCFAAAVATTLQVPIDEVPDPRLWSRKLAGEDPEEIDRSAKREMARWLAARGLQMVVHRQVPAARRRWIGIIPGGRKWFTGHSLVMSGDRIIFDPITDLRLPALAEIVGMQEAARIRVFAFRAEDVAYGLSFQRARGS